MSLRKVIELERGFFEAGIHVALKVKDEGIFIEGPDLADRLIACSELKKRKINVSGHAHKIIDTGVAGMAAI